MEIEYIETKDFSEIIPKYMMTEELCKKVGDKAILQWFLAEPVPKEDEDGALYQEITIQAIRSFSEKLNSTFFSTIANQFEFRNNSGNKTYLFFKLKPIAPPSQTSRISWWEENIVCTEYENDKWKFSEEKILFLNEIYARILKHGEVRIRMAVNPDLMLQ